MVRDRMSINNTKIQKATDKNHFGIMLFLFISQGCEETDVMRRNGSIHAQISAGHSDQNVSLILAWKVLKGEGQMFFLQDIENKYLFMPQCKNSNWVLN